jgi:hypothetical protein
MMWKAAPPSGRFSAHCRPPWAAAIERQIERPRPRPLFLVVAKGSKRRLLTLCGTADQPVYPVSSLLSAASRKADNVSYVLDFFARRIALNRARFF